jgi:type III pantothenate kinase
MILLVDIGNTRIKWATFDGRALGPLSAHPHANWTREELITKLIRSTQRPDRVVVSNVGGAKIAELLRATMVTEWQVQPEFVESTASAGGVRGVYPDPAKLGVDRWMAMIGARAMEPRAACVVSIGTAMTIDALDAEGRHLGGVIVPGPDLMVGSLLRNTSEIARRAEQGSVAANLFADNTLGAITQGAKHSLAALIERAVRTIARDVGQEPALLMTGGAAADIEKSLTIAYKVIPDLVLRGLAVVAAEIR